MVFEFTGQGFVPTIIDPVPLEDVSAVTFLGAQIATKHPVVKDWNVIDTLREVDYDNLPKEQAKYHPWRELKYDSGYPVAEGFKDSEALGWHFQFKDPAQLHQLELTTSYSWDSDLPSDQRLHANLQYKALNWFARYWHNDADFYDLFGPTKRSRKGDAFIVGYDRALIYDDPRRLDFSAQAAYYTGLDTLPTNQNVSTISFEDILGLDLTLDYTNTRKSLGSVDHEKGYRWNIALSVDDTDLDTTIKPHAGLDIGFALPWKHSSIWFYNAVGLSNGDRNNPLANFYFGGFGNNYVDDGEVKRYREYDSLPGFEIDEISGQEFIKSTVEWNLPPIRFKSVGKPGFFLKHVRPAVFFSALMADPGEPFERTLTSAGAQLDLEFTLAHRLPMTFSLGYATGFEDGNSQDEWLVSLKIL